MPNGGDSWDRPGHKIPERQRQPGERLWTLRKAGRRFDCELRFHGESYGWEAQLLRDGDIRMCRGGFTSRALAVQWAELERQALASDGWESAD